MLAGDLFDPFKQVWTHLAIKKDFVVTDNWIYFLHRKCSFVFALIALIFIASQPVVIESPLQCLGPHEDEFPVYFIREYCWTHGTYVILEHFTGVIGKDVPHPGIGPDVKKIGPRTYVELTKIYQMHYIFYPVIILVQLVLFRCAKYLWKWIEGNRMQSLLRELTVAIIDNETMKKRLDLVTDYMTSVVTFHNSYAYKYIACEFYNCLNVIFQFFLINYLLNNEFLNFGWDVVRYVRSVSDGTAVGLVDPMLKIFPKLTKCKFVPSGPSGNAVPHEALCVMPLNNVAEKIFFFTWFWLVILGTITLLGMVYRCLVLMFSSMRYAVLRFKVKRSFCSSNDLKYVVKHSSYGDWFVLSLMQKNVDAFVFSQLIDELVVKMKEARKEKEL